MTRFICESLFIVPASPLLKLAVDTLGGEIASKIVCLNQSTSNAGANTSGAENLCADKRIQSEKMRKVSADPPDLRSYTETSSPKIIYAA
ncbi:MAG: hypothetical protein KME43_02255 [Myxacorys chilensis ATA2-1-KO14]|jgi:hypothetical protein|nr:hypothetical protein [Myxacorys chilensis ATA2-1-KO14]